MYVVNNRLYHDFRVFSTALVHSIDIDPVYPLLKYAYKRSAVPDEVSLWRTLLFLAYYHLGSAQVVWTLYPEPTIIPPDHRLIGLPAGIDRRMMRGNDKAREFINAALTHARAQGGLRKWVNKHAGKGGTKGWKRMREDFEQVLYVGPWASHKWADLMMNVHDFAIHPDNAVGAVGKTSGPVPGMMLLLPGRTWEECARDVRMQKWLLDKCISDGVPFNGLDHLESACCYFSGLVGGRYYVGRNIDIQMGQLKIATTAELWEARDIYQNRYRGECGGWFGVRTELKPHYKRTGKIVVV